jgi:hypothetical protein
MRIGARRTEQFIKFLASRDCDLSSATPTLKICWLISLLRDERPIHPRTIYQYALDLRDLGPRSKHERERQHQIVRAFALELLGNPRLADVEPPLATMPFSVFRRIIASLRQNPKRFCPLLVQFAGTVLKVVWWTGLDPVEVRAARVGWLVLQNDGYLLNCDGPLRRQKRVLFVGRARNKNLCAANALDQWLTIAPNNPKAYLFPFLNARSTRWSEPAWSGQWSVVLKRTLRNLGIRERYTLLSLRRAFLARARDELGEAAAFALSGLASPQALFHTLRGEPDWSSFRSVLEEAI